MMTVWDHIAAVNLTLAATFLLIHAVMVGNPQYGWQPRSLVVRTVMVVLAVYLGARAYTIFVHGDTINALSQQIAAVMAVLFFVTWLDMIVTSWRAQMEKVRAAAERDLAAAVIEKVGAVAIAGAQQSAENHEALTRIEKAVSILEPAPAEFKATVSTSA